MRLFVFAALICALAGQCSAQRSHLQLVSRVVDLSKSPEDQLEFVKRNDLVIDLSANFTAVEGINAVSELSELTDNHLYHLRVLDQSDEALAETVIEPCQLRHRKSKPFKEVLTLYYDRKGQLEDIAYATQDQKFTCDSSLDIAKYTKQGEPSSTSLSIVLRQAINPATLLKDPPAIQWDEDGRPKPPPREKSFIEKYWVYVIPFVLVLLIPAPDEAKK